MIGPPGHFLAVLLSILLSLYLALLSVLFLWVNSRVVEVRFHILPVRRVRRVSISKRCGNSQDAAEINFINAVGSSNLANSMQR